MFPCVFVFKKNCASSSRLIQRSRHVISCKNLATSPLSLLLLKWVDPRYNTDCRYPRVQASSQCKVQGMHPCVITCLAAPEPASCLGRALALPRVTSLWNPFRRASALPHVPQHRNNLFAYEGSGTNMCPSALNHTPPERWAPALTRTHGTSRAVGIKKGLVITACSEAHVFLRHACALPRCLQDVRASGVIMT
jgi:hypothetical protein